MQQKRNIDYTLAFTIAILICFGVTMISSVSVYPSYKVTAQMVATGKLLEPNNYFYLMRNIMHAIIAFGVCAVFVKIPYSIYEKHAKNIFLVGLLSLFAVMFIGVRYNGAQWWINIPLLPFQLQPAELVKFTLIIQLASFLKKKTFDISSLHGWLFPFLIIFGAVAVLLAIQPDFWTILIIGPVAFMMFYFGGGNIRHLFLLMLTLALGAASVYGLGKVEFWGGVKNPLSYISSRIDNFASRDEKKSDNKNATVNFQTQQGLISIGSGGFGGLGFGKSIQKFGYLPEVQGDFIFSVIAEEFGFLWVMFLVSIFLLIFYRGMLIVAQVKDLFGKYLAFGITTLITFQAFINIGVNLNIIPLTGVTLPFISYGGSSLVFSMIGIAILLNISRERNPEIMLTLREKMFSKKRMMF